MTATLKQFKNLVSKTGDAIRSSDKDPTDVVKAKRAYDFLESVFRYNDLSPKHQAIFQESDLTHADYLRAKERHQKTADRQSGVFYLHFR